MPRIIIAGGVDNLIFLPSKSKNAIDKANLYVKLIYSVSQYDSAVLYANRGLAFSEKEKNLYGLAFINTTMVRLAAEFGKYEEALSWGEKAIKTSNSARNDSMISKAHYYIGYIYYTMSNFEKAAESYINSVRFAEKCGDLKSIAAAYNVLGLTFATKKPKDYVKALEYYFKAEEIDRKIKSFRDMGFVFLRIGAVYVNLSEFEKAKIYLDKAMHLGDSLKDFSVQKWTIETYAGMYKQLKNYNSALLLYLKSLNISRNLQEWPGIVSSATSIADIYNKMGDSKNAMLYADSSINNCIKFKIYSALGHAYKCKSSIFITTGDFKNAFRWYKLAIDIKDSLFKKENSENLNELEKKYETEKKEKELTEKKGELLIQKADNEKQRVQRNFFIAGLSLLLVFLFFVFRSYRNKKRANEIITKQKQEVEVKNKLIEEKQKEILDSIHYAKRIQNALITQENYINKTLKRLMKTNFIF